MTLFLALPHLTVNGRPALLLDVAARRFTVAGVTMHPTDNILLMIFGGAMVITIFLATALLGRVWCGWACPQTVWLELLFRPIESWIEGPASIRKKRARQPDIPGTTARKALKLLIYATLALILAGAFLSYFTGWDGLVEALRGGPGTFRGTWVALALVATLAFVDFAFFREQMCTTACPYGRLQSVLYDQDTLIVGYDVRRGEPRGTRRKGDDDAKPLGDCIDCGRCAGTCPMGIDIRNGLQLECVGCTQCIDSCDDVMTRLKRPRGLVRYTSQRELAGGARRLFRPRTIVYVAILAAVYTVFWVMVASRPTAAVEVLRGLREPFHALPGGPVSAGLRLRVTNHLPRDQAFTVKLMEPADATLSGIEDSFVVSPDSVVTLNVALKTPREAFVRGRATGRMRIESDAGLSMERTVPLLGPVRR
jgi:cytochrome c oxidase accessory protein FixG